MKLAIYGAGGMGRDVLALAREMNQWDNIVMVVDSQYLPNERACNGCPIVCLENVESLYDKNELEFLICTGEPKDRKTFCQRVIEKGFSLGKLVHPSVQLHGYSSIADGAVIYPGCVLASGVTVGYNATISFNAVIGHDTIIGEHCSICPGACIAGFTKWGECSLGGLGCMVREQTSIGKYSVVGQGAVVVKDVPDYTTVVGNPAKQLGQTGIRKVFK